MFQYSNKSLFSGSPESVKIVALLVFFVLAFVLQNIEQQAILFVALFFVLLIVGYRQFKEIFFGLIPFLLLADFGIWIFLQETSINVSNLIIVSNLRIFNLVMATAFFSFSTDAFALAKLFKKARLPEIIALPIFALFRFLPELERDFLEIRDIQKLRGISPKRPWHYLKSILVPLFITALQKSDEIAIAYYLKKKAGKA